MKKCNTKRIAAGMLFSVLVTSLVAIPVSQVVGGGTTYAASTKESQQLATVYARIQKEHATEVVKMVNQVRVKAGLKPLVVHTNLSNMAKKKQLKCTIVIISVILLLNTVLRLI